MYTFSAGRKYRVSVLMPILLQCCQEPRGAGIFYEYLTFFLRKGLINTGVHSGRIPSYHSPPLVRSCMYASTSVHRARRMAMTRRQFLHVTLWIEQSTILWKLMFSSLQPWKKIQNPMIKRCGNGFILTEQNLPLKCYQSLNKTICQQRRFRSFKRDTVSFCW